MTDKKSEIKSFACDGKFNAVLSNHGNTAHTRAKEYATTKVVALRARRDAGENIEEIGKATPFLLFAVGFDPAADIEVIANKFYSKENGRNSDDGWESDATDPQMNVVVDGDADANPGTNPGADPEAAMAAHADDEVQTQRQEEEEDAEMLPALSMLTQPKKGGFQMPSSQHKPTKAIAVQNKVTPSPKVYGGPKDKPARPAKTASKGVSSKGSSKKAKGEQVAEKKKSTKASFPNAPKGPKNAYMCFVESERKVVLAEDSSLTMVAVSKELGARWKLLEEGDKVRYADRAVEDKERFEREFQEYTDEFPEEAVEYKTSKTTKGTKDAKSAKSSKKSKAGTKKRARRARDEDDDEEDSETETPSRKRKTSSSSSSGGKKIRKSKGKGSDDDADDEEEDGEEAEFVGDSTPRNPSRRAKTVVPKSGDSLKGLLKKTRPTTSSADQPPVVVLDPHTTNTRAAKVVSSLKGIKQSDLPDSENIEKANIMANDRGPYPADFLPSVGVHVVLILEPYREFISELPLDLISNDELVLVQTVCSLSAATATGTVVSTRSATDRGSGSSCASAVADASTLKDASEASFVTVNFGGEHYTLLYAPLSSPIFRADVFLLDQVEYKKVLKAPWLVPNVQVRRVFAPDVEDDKGGEWLEGSIYHVREDYKSNPYRSISVVWLKLEKNPRRWFYAAAQVDNMCSPWDLSLSKYVLQEKAIPENGGRFVLPPSLASGPVDALAVLTYLKQFDYTSVFMYQLTQNEEFCEVFPDPADQLDLNVLDGRRERGLYQGIGVNALFADLERMVANGKQFNSVNKDFQPWRLCDMMEKTVANLKDSLGARLAPAPRPLALSSSSRNELLTSFEGEGETADLDAMEEEEV